MFYSHEILTSREGGVATVWLLATLGPKSILKRVNRKAILEVDVPKTCGIIITPQAPMALRLQSNLLYGVSRVYDQQCEYVLSDAQQAQSNIRTLLKAVRTAELDPNAGKARPDQLVIQDDPAFIPDFIFPGLDLDLSVLDITTNSSSLRSSLLSPHSKLSSASTRTDGAGSVVGLIIPTSDTGGAGDLGGFILPEDHPSSVQRSARLGGLLEGEEEGFNLDPGFTVDADGNLVLTEGSGPLQREADILALSEMNMGPDFIMTEPAQEEVVSGRGRGQPESRRELDLDPDRYIPVFHDEEMFLPVAEAFPEMILAPPISPGPLHSLLVPHAEEQSSQNREGRHHRRPRVLRLLPRDDTTELRHADLARWHDNYVENMTSKARLKLQHRAPMLSKRNARLIVLESGIGGLGPRFSSAKVSSPLAMFSGENLLQALTGAGTTGLEKKRRHEEGAVSDAESRRVRLRESDWDQIGRGDQPALPDDGALALLPGEDIEIGREARPALEDQSFPWNMSASATESRPGSVARPFGVSSSVGHLGSLVGPGGSASGSFDRLDRRASRITSASPLLGRGQQRYSSLDLPIPENDDELLGLHELSASNEADEFQLYGPAAGVSTQVAAESQWMRAMLDQESSNFLDFIRAEITRRSMAFGGADEGDTMPRGTANEVLFEDLLPPAQHTKVVAAQALHHVIALATKSLIGVEQTMAYGPITLRLQTQF